MIMGTVIGFTRSGPLEFKMSYCSKTVDSPPIPVPKKTPRRSLLISGEPASAQASLTAITPNWVLRSILRALTRSNTSKGSTVTRPAI